MTSDWIVSHGWPILHGGLANLAAYLAAHVLLCLLPAFFIAGAMVALIPPEMITRFLGRTTPKIRSYPAAAAAGSLLAVCSCTIVPLFAGIYRKGAGLGPAITFLFFAPAANILALIYTGGIIGPDLAVARLILSLLFGIGIGMVMALLFRQDDAANEQSAQDLFEARSATRMSRGALLFLFALIALLLAGTLKLAALTQSYAYIHLPLSRAAEWQAILDVLVPFDAARGEEGVSLHGALLIALLGAIGIAAWRGVENITSGANRWTAAAGVLTGLTLMCAAMSVQVTPQGVVIGVTGRFLGVTAVLLLAGYIARTRLSEDDRTSWLWESWRFVKQIFPLLLAGVFAVGMLRVLVQPEWIQAVAGENTIAANLAGVVFGVFMYFPTLVEVPIARMFLDLGMHPGPLLAYLMSDPELSLQSILVIAAIIGRRKAWTYVGCVALCSAVAGYIYGAWIDGAGLLQIAGAVALVAGLVALVIRAIDHAHATPKGAAS